MATFLYFAYGSNLCKRRLQINCPSAELVCFAELRDYRLRFFNLRGIQSDWHGAAATLKQENGAITWGAVWRISHDHSDNLDRYTIAIYFLFFQAEELLKRMMATDGNNSAAQDMATRAKIANFPPSIRSTNPLKSNR